MNDQARFYCSAVICLSAALLGIASETKGECSSPRIVSKWGSYGSGEGQFRGANSIARNSAGEIYVADDELHRVQKFDALGNYILGWGSYGQSDGQFWGPHSVAVDDSGDVYVADHGNMRIQKFDASGAFLLKWGRCCSGPGRFEHPRGVAVRGSSVYVVDEGRQVQQFDLYGNLLNRWGGSAFDTPSGIAIDAANNVFVVDIYASMVTKFDAAGSELMRWGSYGTDVEQFNYPSGIGVDGSGNVYVMDTFNQRVQVFDNDGRFLCLWGSSDPQTEIYLVSPRGITFDKNGGIYLCDSSRGITLQMSTPVSRILWGGIKRIYR